MSQAFHSARLLPLPMVLSLLSYALQVEGVQDEVSTARLTMAMEFPLPARSTPCPSLTFPPSTLQIDSLTAHVSNWTLESKSARALLLGADEKDVIKATKRQLQRLLLHRDQSKAPVQKEHHSGESTDVSMDQDRLLQEEEESSSSAKPLSDGRASGASADVSASLHRMARALRPEKTQRWYNDFPGAAAGDGSGQIGSAARGGLSKLTPASLERMLQSSMLQASKLLAPTQTLGSPPAGQGPLLPLHLAGLASSTAAPSASLGASSASAEGVSLRLPTLSAYAPSGAGAGGRGPFLFPRRGHPPTAEGRDGGAAGGAAAGGVAAGAAAGRVAASPAAAEASLSGKRRRDEEG